MKDNGNQLVKDIFLDQYEKQSTKWAKTIKNYLQVLNLNLQGLLNMKDLDKRIKVIDSELWKEEIPAEKHLRKISAMER